MWLLVVTVCNVSRIYVTSETFYLYKKNTTYLPFFFFQVEDSQSYIDAGNGTFTTVSLAACDVRKRFAFTTNSHTRTSQRRNGNVRNVACLLKRTVRSDSAVLGSVPLTASA